MKLDFKKFPQAARLRAPRDAAEARYNRLVFSNCVAQLLINPTAEKRAMTKDEIASHDEIVAGIESP